MPIGMYKNNSSKIKVLGKLNGGWGGIRTHETVSRLPVFKTGAFNRSATHPQLVLGSAA